MVSYLNCKTCEVTTDRAKFRAWIRAGFRVEVWRNDKCVMVFHEDYFAGQIVPCNEVLLYGI